MTFWLLIFWVIAMTIFNESQTAKELPPRYWKMDDSIEHELKHKSDSLLNNWKEWAMKDTLWMQH